MEDWQRACQRYMEEKRYEKRESFEACCRLLELIKSDPRAVYDAFVRMSDPTVAARVDAEVERIFAKEREAQ